MSRAVLFSLVLALAPASALAQPRTVVVIPWSVGDADAAALAAHATSATGAIPSGDVSAISIDDARSRFEEHGSAEPPSVSDSDVDRWLTLSREAVRQLARGDYAAAQRSLLEAQQVSEPAAAELNREERRARQVLDTCLYDVRAYIETQDPRAQTRALECRRLVPRITPSPYVHTPEVVEMLERIDRQLASAPPGSLRLTSVPTGCAVRLNGIQLGQTPFVSEDLAPGEYRAQVECDGGVRGRVHRIRIGEGTSAVQVDARFDAAVHTDTALRLSYASQADADAHRIEDAVTAATLVGAAEAWLLSVDPTGGVRIARLSVGSRSVVGNAHAASDAELPSTVASLLHGTLDSAEESGGGSQGTPRSRADWELGLGIGLLAVGVGGFVTSFALLDGSISRGHVATILDPTDPGYQLNRRNWTDTEMPVLIAGWAGGALATAGVALAMGEEDGTPWWGWVLGGTGVAAGVAGAVLVATASTCGTNNRPTYACVGGTAQADVGSTVMSMGAPLLSVPIVFLLREAIGGPPPVVPSASANLDGVTVSLGGSW
jgi:hypothetical protein